MEDERDCPSQEELNESVLLDANGRAYHRRKLVVREDDEAVFWRKLNAWAEKNNCWPSIYSVNDHGNVTEYGYDGKTYGSWV